MDATVTDLSGEEWLQVDSKSAKKIESNQWNYTVLYGSAKTSVILPDILDQTVTWEVLRLCIEPYQSLMSTLH